MVSITWTEATIETVGRRGGMPNWVNSSFGIHTFLTFDSNANPNDITKFGSTVDYVWGASKKNINNWKKASPSIILSYYMPFTRDPSPHPTGTPPSSLPWFQKNYPELVLYQCDKKTPAWECYSGEACSHVSVPLDLTNPATLTYQINVGIIPASKAGYNSIALDNYDLQNSWSACGSYKGKNGAWVQLYDANDPIHDPQYTLDVLEWTRLASIAIHKLGLLVIPNYSKMTLDSNTLAVANYTDGFLAEGGFTSWNPKPNTSSFNIPPPFTNPTKFKQQVQFVRHLQNAGKGFFAINEWGEGPDYHLNPSCQPHNITRQVRQFVAAAFMMTNGESSGIFLTCTQCYGGDCGGVGNFSIWTPEFNAKVGVPMEEPTMNETNGVWSRLYSTGLTFVNPDNMNHYTVSLPKLSGSIWQDVYGNEITGSVINLEPATGMILVHEDIIHK